MSRPAISEPLALCPPIGAIERLASIARIVAFGLALSSTAAPAQLGGQLDQNVGEYAPRYSIVCIVHGDGDYLYHDSSGAEARADEHALAAAISVAERNRDAEVFVFHQKPREHVLFFFPLHDGEFYYYRHGTLLAQESYWRDQGQLRYDPELTFYRSYRAGEGPQTVKVFLYFGHEIPEYGAAGYDASYSDRDFGVQDLAAGLNGFTQGGKKFDLVVLSTCFNGTPHTVASLAPYAGTIVASPDNLHLSYFDLSPFEQPHIGVGPGEVHAFARSFAEQSFDRLSAELQTAVTIAVYDVDRVRPYLDAVSDVCNDALSSSGQEGSEAPVVHCDCAEEQAYLYPGMDDGVEVFYRASRFGRLKNKSSRSGWECWKLIEPEAPNVQTGSIERPTDVRIAE